MRYLFLNTFKAILKKKTFFIGIMLIMILASTLFSLFLNISSNLKDSFSNYKNNQNIEDFSFLAKSDLSKEDIDKFYVENKNVTLKHKKRIDTYYNIIDDKTITNAKRENLKEDAMFAMSNYIDVLPFRYVSANTLAQNHNFDYESQYIKDIVQNINGIQHAFRMTPYNSNNKINIPYLIEGKFPTESGEIALYPEYLKANNLKIGSNITIRNVKYKIVGVFYEPEFIFPKIDLSSVFFESDKQTLVLNYATDFHAIKNIDMECYLVGRFKNKNTDIKTAVRKISNDKDSSYTLNYIENLSIGGGLFTMLSVFDTVSVSVLGAFTIISMLIVFFVVRKQIIEDKKKLGILKSLGYKSFYIAFSYIIYGAIAGVSAIIGFLIAMNFKNIVLIKVRGYFVLPLLDNSINYSLLVISFITLFTTISLISIGIAYTNLRTRTINLINPKENDEINWVTKFVAKVTENADFKKRFKYTLASRSLSKLISIILLTTLCGILITSIFISSNFFPALEQNFSNYKYDYQVTYNNGLLESDKNNGLQNKDTVMIDVKATIDEVNGVQTLNNKSTDGEFLHIMGIEENNETYPIYDMKGNLIHTRKDGIIVTSNFLTMFNAKMGDTVTITPKSKYDYRFDVKIVGLSSNFTDGPGVFLDRTYLNEKLGNEKDTYNVRMTNSIKGTELGTVINNSKVITVVSMADVKHNYKKMSSIARYVVLILEGFMGALTMTLIALLSHLVIEENANKISLLKIMGFSKSEIDSMVLNIYTPFILLSVFMAIPLSILIIKIAFYFIFAGVNVAFPIKLSILQIIMSVLIIFIGYWLSLKLNRKSLNKIPMSIGLKRE